MKAQICTIDLDMLHIQNIKIYWIFQFNLHGSCHGCLGASSICMFLFSLQLIIHTLQLYIRQSKFSIAFIFIISMYLMQVYCIMCCIFTNTLVRPQLCMFLMVQPY